MPLWAQIIIWIAAVIVACGVIWTKVLKPGAKLIALMDKALPLLRDMTHQFEHAPNAFKILQEIVAEFRTDSGSSLKDVVNSLAESARANKVAVEVLKVNAEAIRLLAKQDREQIARLVVLLDKTVAADKVVAANLAESMASVHKTPEPDHRASEIGGG
jgi:hypothetical protein